jgi:hypothetical protein
VGDEIELEVGGRGKKEGKGGREGGRQAGRQAGREVGLETGRAAGTVWTATKAKGLQGWPRRAATAGVPPVWIAGLGARREDPGPTRVAPRGRRRDAVADAPHTQARSVRIRGRGGGIGESVDPFAQNILLGETHGQPHLLVYLLNLWSWIVQARKDSSAPLVQTRWTVENRCPHVLCTTSKLMDFMAIGGSERYLF